jgi:predicted dehydrogenase
VNGRSGGRRRIGLVGCGTWGRHILRDLVSLGCAVTVVARSERSLRAAEEGGADAVVPSTRDLPDVDGIVVASPTNTHGEVIDGLLARGVPIYTEKPMTIEPESAARLAAAAPDRLFVMDKWRYHPGVELLAEIVSSGTLGAPLGLRSTRIGWGSSHTDVDAIWILLPHDLSIALELFGQVPSARWATAEVVKGAPTGLVGVAGEQPWTVVEVSSRSPLRRREIQLHCEGGVAVLPDAFSDEIEMWRDDGETGADAERLPISTELPLIRELRAFVEHLEGGPPPKSSAAEGAAIVAQVAKLRSLAGLD